MVESPTAAQHQTTPHPALLDQVFHALADQTRRALLRDIVRREHTVGELAQPYAMSLAAVSKHLDVLERASLIRRERRGACRMVRLNPKPLQDAQHWLAFYEQFWSSNLDRLQNLLERRPAPRPDPITSANHRPAKKK
jgi:DNA-binding transcriptional ArsR family regulator